ncbi:MAG: 4Fe-4S dicluster domain-containing protein [Alphaproteobacteria bacterium]|nr:4Fe-4S dicluster domain-containing protein [Alphaproteobacteria bacterium]
MTKNHVKIENSECKGCGVCVDACPKGCLTIGKEINEQGYAYVKFDSENCTACGMCFYVCPEPGAITVYKAEKK